jgi:hypothetical protein
MSRYPRRTDIFSSGRQDSNSEVPERNDIEDDYKDTKEYPNYGFYDSDEEDTTLRSSSNTNRFYQNSLGVRRPQALLTSMT